MKKLIFCLCLMILLLSTGILFELHTKTKPVITYFPIDEQQTFISANTSLQLLEKEKNASYTVNWGVHSKSEKILYLRQDASLLYVNGFLKGVRNKWLQQTDIIEMDEIVPGQGSLLWEAISFHHGEIHHPTHAITSIQKMSYDQLYVNTGLNDDIISFKTAKTSQEEKIKRHLDRFTKQQLLFHWNELIDYFKIDSDRYEIIPLTELNDYNDQSLPSLTKEQTEKIIGQLWEGLYKNYIIPILQSDDDSITDSYIPIILFDKQNTHLLVLFSLHGKKEKLIQQYSNL